LNSSIMKALVAGALLLDCACAFTGLTPLAAGSRRPACVGARPGVARRGDLHVVASLMPSSDRPPWLVELPGHVSDAMAGMPTHLRHRLSDMANAQRLADKRERRAVMEEQAEEGASLVCKIYFQSLKDSNQYGDQRISRQHQDDAEKAHNDHHHRHADRNLVSSITKTMKRRQSQARRPSPDTSAMLVHESVAATLELVGIQNRIDFTQHDGMRYMDVVVDAHDGDRVRGLVIQVLAPGHRPSYVDIKTAALREDGWAVITVKPGDWERKETTEARASWLARKLVRSGYWRSGSEAGSSGSAALNAR